MTRSKRLCQRLPHSAPAAAGVAVAMAVIGGCAMQRYEPRPLDAAESQARWLAATTDDAALRDALQRQGVDVSIWPLPAWDLPALTALALARQPELAVARAELRSAEAARAGARERIGQGAEFTVEHHSADGASTSPWSLGVVVDGIVGGRARRSAQADQADALALEAAELAAQAAWHVRQRVRSAWRELYFANRHTQIAQALFAAQHELADAAQTQLMHGAIDRPQALRAQQAERAAAQQASAASDAAAHAKQALAAAVGLSSERFDTLMLRFDALASDAPIGPAEELQRAALINRLDVRAALARYAATDAALKLEWARQWPEIVLRPGYNWDQGDHRWSLGVGLNLPPGGNNRAAIDEARARRDAEAERFDALQFNALASLDAARQAVAAAAGQRDAARARWQQARQLADETRRRFDAGDTDRIDRASAALAEAESERDLIDAEAAGWAAVGALEDAVQQPLEALGNRNAVRSAGL